MLVGVVNKEQGVACCHSMDQDIEKIKRRDQSVAGAHARAQPAGRGFVVVNFGTGHDDGNGRGAVLGLTSLDVVVVGLCKLFAFDGLLDKVGEKGHGLKKSHHENGHGRVDPHDAVFVLDGQCKDNANRDERGHHLMVLCQWPVVVQVEKTEEIEDSINSGNDAIDILIANVKANHDDDRNMASYLNSRWNERLDHDDYKSCLWYDLQVGAAMFDYWVFCLLREPTKWHSVYITPARKQHYNTKALQQIKALYREKP